MGYSKEYGEIWKRYGEERYGERYDEIYEKILKELGVDSDEPWKNPSPYAQRSIDKEKFLEDAMKKQIIEDLLSKDIFNDLNETTQAKIRLLLGDVYIIPKDKV